MSDPLKEITKSITYTFPQLGDNVLRNAKLLRICKNIGCGKPVFVSKLFVHSGRVEYSCPEHGKRNRQQMDWGDVTGSTMMEFRKFGFQKETEQ